jgi:hypothetical protein
VNPWSGLYRVKMWGRQNVLFGHLAIVRLLGGYGVGQYVNALRYFRKIKFRAGM